MSDPLSFTPRVRLESAQSQVMPRRAGYQGAPGTSFATTLRDAMPGPKSVALSAHASERLEQRGIRLDAERWAAVDDAVEALAAKGSRDGLILGEEVAFIVNVPNRTMITALTPEEARRQVFTQIDSAAVLPQRETVQHRSSTTHGPDPLQGSPGAADRQTRRPILEV